MGVFLFGLVWFGLYNDTPTAPLSADNVPAEKGQMIDARFIEHVEDFHLVIH